jgi:hypothetical protein
MHPLPEAPDVDASIRYLVARSPISDPYARYQQAEKMEREVLINNSHLYFQPWEAIFEANPQRILESGEKIEMVPLFILQGEFDDNVLPEVQQRFVHTYRADGGEIEFEVFPKMEHRWIINPGPQTDRAIAMIEDFIARHVA